MICIARVFEKTSKNNRRYFYGRLGFSDVLIFKDEKEPEGNVWRILLKEHPYDPNAAQRPTGGGQYAQSGQAGRQLPPDNRDIDDEIPF